MEAEEQGFQDGKPHIAQDAVSAASGLGAAFKLLCKIQDAGALVSVAGDAVLAWIGNKPGAAAKVVSHGDVSQASARVSAGKPISFSEMACDLRENQRGKALLQPFLRD